MLLMESSLKELLQLLRFQLRNLVANKIRLALEI